MLEQFIKKRAAFNFSGQKLIFDFSQSLFSSAEVDLGTKVLLNSLRKNQSLKYGKILDLGCGHGIVGIFLKKQHPESEIDATDRDALAIEFTKHNAALNNVEIKVYPSLDYQNVESKFDLIITNFPAKAGIKALKKFVYSASQKLNKGGQLAIVVVRELTKDIESVLNENTEVTFKEKKTGYSIYHIKFRKEIDYDEDVYLRNKVEFRIADKKYKLNTAFNIPEFESQSFATECILKIIKNMRDINEVVIINPFQGHSALGVLALLNPKSITLISRDLLSLNYSKSNLEQNGFSNIQTINDFELKNKLGDLLVWTPNPKEELELLVYQFNKLKSLYPKIILASESKIIRRFLQKTRKKPRVLEEKRASAAVLI